MPTIVYLFSPECGFCRKNEKKMAALVSNVSGKYRVLGVSLATDRLDEFLHEAGIHFPVYTNLEPEVAKAYKAGATPQTFVIGRDGRLRAMWTGAFTGDNEKSVGTYFKFHLPG